MQSGVVVPLPKHTQRFVTVREAEEPKESTDVTMVKLVDKTLNNQKMAKVFNREKKEDGL